jgi:hypothetical protein
MVRRKEGRKERKKEGRKEGRKRKVVRLGWEPRFPLGDGSHHLHALREARSLSMVVRSTQ